MFDTESINENIYENINDKINVNIYENIYEKINENIYENINDKIYFRASCLNVMLSSFLKEVN